MITNKKFFFLSIVLLTFIFYFYKGYFFEKKVTTCFNQVCHFFDNKNEKISFFYEKTHNIIILDAKIVKFSVFEQFVYGSRLPLVFYDCLDGNGNLIVKDKQEGGVEYFVIDSKKLNYAVTNDINEYEFWVLNKYNVQLPLKVSFNVPEKNGLSKLKQC